jgi:AcrR family transcriptional regulator
MARRILAAAERHFAAQGMEGARTEEIAMAARANKAMLYYYFGNKRRLHRAVLENLLRQLRSGVLAPPAKKLSAKQKLFRYVSGYFDFLATHPNYPRLVQREAMESRPNFDWMARGYFRPLIQGLSRVVEE